MLYSAGDAKEIKTKLRISEFRKMHGVEKTGTQTSDRTVLSALEVYKVLEAINSSPALSVESFPSIPFRKILGS